MAGVIEHVSDTAHWVAVYRAIETERADAHFRDPYARRLAGPRGEAIARSLRLGRATAWAMVVRTQVFDEMLLRAIERDGVDLVLNLAAGLDARPYRLALPSRLRWVEVDLPGMIAYKEAQLRDARPSCALERVALDLRDVAGRRALFARLSAEARRVLVVSEGLLVYLTAGDVAGLASDLHAAPSFGVWLTELASPLMLRLAQRRYGRPLARGGAPMRFAPAAGGAYFEPYGWVCTAERSLLEEARRLHREMPLAWLARLTLVTRRRRQTWRQAAVLVELTRI
jgi:methyltransferase (TIGR00027 family)